MRIFFEDAISGCFRISVEGYDTSLPADDIKDVLRNHFYSCGEVCEVEVPRDPLCAFVYIQGKDSEKHALALNGRDLGGWIAVIQSLPKIKSTIDPNLAGAIRAAHVRKQSSTMICIKGYDTSLPLDHVKSALIRLFSSCGEITDLCLSKDSRTNVLESWASIYFYGQDAAARALKLSGTDVGGWKVVAEPLPEPTRVIPDHGFYYGSTVPAISSDQQD
ncbi:unnamed protein product [Arabis nemorensis]|uniref:RRM domain-containing protein n=1 Tax=Arabis nemorensis TaxID=586526 RepID=A0A565CEI3_9BRAS|nr:unnamed protein product [Arabis nemorensis]